MFTLFKNKLSENLTGIVSSDVGTAVVRLSRKGNTDVRLKSCQFEPYAVDNDQTWESFVKGMGLDRQICSMLLNIGEYQLLVVDAPDVPPQELRSAVRWNIQDLIDFHIDEAILDVFDAPPGGPAGTQKQMYVVVVQNTMLRDRIDALENLGVNLKIIDIPELAMRNLAARLPEDEYGLVTIHIGQQQCLITITHQATLYLTRTIDFQYSDLNNNAAESGNLCNRLALEIQRSLDYYEQHFRKAAIQSIALLPSPVVLDELETTLQQTLGLKTRTISLYDVIGSDQELDTEMATACMLAAGCALRTEQPTL